MVIMANGNIEMSNNSNLLPLNVDQAQLLNPEDEDNSIIIIDDHDDDSSIPTVTNNYYSFFNNESGNGRGRSSSHNSGSTSTSHGSSSSYGDNNNAPPSGILSGTTTTTTSNIVKVGLYDIGEVIGEGNFATVRFARHRHTKSDVAIKIIDKTKLSKSDLDKVHREIEIMRLLNHPNIIKLYQVMKTDKLLYLVTEYAPKGEIFDHIVTNGKLNESDARQKFWQIMSALDYCHKNRVVHRDLKAENLLLDANGNIKIADFGFGNQFSPDDKLSTFCGSPPYAAPELFEGKTYTGPEVDIWSLGVVLYVLVCGGLPFYGDNLRDLKDRVLKGVFRIPYWMSEGCEHLIRRMLVRDPDKRYSLDQIKKHRWVLADGPPKQIKSVSSSCFSTDQGGVDDPYSEQVLRMMDQLGLERQKTIEQLNKNNVYSHYTAIYQLLLDRTRLHRSSYPLDRPSFDYRQQRRPSTLADNALSQTAYLQQLHQASLARAAQMDSMVPSVPAVNLPPSLPHSSHVPTAVAHVPLTATGTLHATPSMETSYSTSAESGLEIDMDLSESYGGGLHPSSKPPLARRHTLTAMTGIMPATTWLKDISGPSTDSGSGMELPSQSHSIESNLDYSDVHNTQQMFDCFNEGGGLEPQPAHHYPMDDRNQHSLLHASVSEKVQLDARDAQRQKARSPINFREGRRASDGLVCQDVIAFRQKLKDGMKAGGMLELRQEHNQLVESHASVLDSTLSEQETPAIVKVPLGKRMSLPTNSIDLPPHKLLEMKKSIQLNQNLAVSQDFEATHSPNPLRPYEPVHLQPLPSGASLQRQVHNRLLRRQGYKQHSALHQQFQHMHIEQSHVLSTGMTSTARSNKHPPVTRQPSYKLAQQQPIVPANLHMPVLRWPAQTNNFSLGMALTNNGSMSHNLTASSTTAGVPSSGGVNPQSMGLYTSPTT